MQVQQTYEMGIEAVGSAAYDGELNPSTGNILKKVDYPHMVSGIAFDGSMFWCGDCVEGKVRTVDMGLTAAQ